MKKAPIDTLIANWENNWNQHNAHGLKNMFLEDVILIENDIICKSIQELDEKWIQPNLNNVKDLKTFKMQEWSTESRAGYTGTYEVEVTIDSVNNKLKGVFTVTWMKTEQEEWKISSAMIHAFLT
ncbi:MULTISPECIES: hypothetical protein [unclassified Lentimicrobium]|uniref:hypothetical protein n=1 Tax=unclassified Lentimicrobium TaxID=2677434 RepID=UPI0015575A9A|nr:MULTISPECIES: hypothetical protein [unclassified Lentimicrobium]NPD47340.1 hypothetical protein [Lentimicrobium sp. S6]NPD85334.1 hypothetical protein [Lentimicrobium sp. L6]